MPDANNEAAPRRGGMSPQLDALTTALLGGALDRLATGEDLNVILVVEDASGNDASYEFSDDGPEELLLGARETVGRLAREGGDPASGLGVPRRYAMAYEAAVGTEDGSFHDAVLLEFGERGYRSFSAYSLVEGKGAGDGLSWTEPLPAGELEPLL